MKIAQVVQVVETATNLFVWVGVLTVLILCGFLLVECVAALWPLSLDKQVGKQFSYGDKRVTVIIPAHNEENAIARTLKQLNTSGHSNQDVVVIADNCDDNTVEIARRHGARVIERCDVQRRGKGYALDYGIRYLRQNPPDILVMIDADCDVDRNTIPLLTHTAIATGKPVQANYLMNTPEKPTATDGISAFAFKVKNLVRSRGLARLGLPCVLAGTGMAFPWYVIEKVNLASGHIVEDMKLGLDLNLAGYGAVFCPEARVFGTLPSNKKTAKTQRTRWEHGHLQTLFTYVPILVKSALQQRRWDLFWSAVDLAIPPLSLLVMLWVGVVVMSFSLALVTSFWLPTIIALIAGIFLFSGIFISWSKFAKTELPLGQLLTIPLYILGKIPLYFRFLIKPERNWIRTERE